MLGQQMPWDLFVEEVGGHMAWGVGGREQSGRWGGADDRGPCGTEHDERRRNLPVSHRITVVATGQAAGGMGREGSKSWIQGSQWREEEAA